MRAELGYTIEELNLGGGFGIRYVAQDDPKALESYMEAVSKVVLGFCETNSFPVPFICIEPWYGRADAADFDGNLQKRAWQNELEPGKVFGKVYTIAF